MDIFHKPYYDYTLLDHIIVLGICLAGIVVFYGIKLGILCIKLYLKNRRDRDE